MDHTIEAIYRSLAPAVTGYFRSHGIRDADDLTGDVFERVAGGLATFRGNDAALRRWVFTIAHHRLVDEYRSARRNETVTDHPPDVASVDEPTAVDEDLMDALAALSDEQREVVVLRFVADLSVRDVAKITGKRTGAVKMLQSRGLDALRGSIEQSS